MKLRAYLEVIWKRLWVVVGLAILIVGAYSFFFFTQSPQYTASARIMLRLPPEWEEMPTVRMPGWTTRVALIQSKPVLNQTVKKLKKEGINLTTGRLNGGLSVRDVEGTDFVDIRYTGKVAQEAIKAVNIHAQVFLEYDTKNNRETLVGARQSLETELEKASERLSEAEVNLSQANRLDNKKSQLKKLKDRYIEVQNEFGEKHFRRLNIEARIKKLKEEIYFLQEQFFPGKPRPKNLSRWLAEEVNPEIMERRVKSYQQRVRKLQQDYDLVQFNMSLLDRSGQMVAKASNAQENYPATAQTYAFVGLLGIVFGVSIASLLEYLNDRIESKFDINLYLDLPVLGVIPEVEPGNLNLMQNPKKAPLGERYHEISGLLQFSMLREEKQRSILVTSTEGGEGKSINALNLSVALSQEGENVLLVDMDLQNPQQHKYFDLMNNEGVSEIISGDVELEEIMLGDKSKEGKSRRRSLSSDSILSRIEKTEDELPDVLPSGYLPMNRIQVLKNRLTDELIEIVSEYYNVVIIDSSPISSVIDPVIISTKVDGVVMVVGSGEVRKADAHHSKNLLQEVGAPILGIVLNKMEYDIRDYYYPYGSSTNNLGNSK